MINALVTSLVIAYYNQLGVNRTIRIKSSKGYCNILCDPPDVEVSILYSASL